MVFKYFTIVFFINLFAIVYVWQNVEVMKIKLKSKDLAVVREKIINRNDKLRYLIERYKRMDIIQKQVTEKGYKEIRPGDFDVLFVSEKNIKGKNNR